ncbi:MAG: 4Fe-4S binding protein [Rhodocyclaceae bacterium]|jgi:ferredoxin
MALEITDACVNCWACEPLCPNKAIRPGKPHFVVLADRCTECLGDYDAPQCAEICPIECAILDDIGEPLNPPGSLTHIPYELALRAAEDARPAP